MCPKFTLPDRTPQDDPRDDAHDAVCETCGRALYAGLDEWSVSIGREADGWTSVVTCQQCDDEAQDWYRNFVANQPVFTVEEVA